MLKTIARMLYKACPRCHGDLVLDDEERLTSAVLQYECLQCGRTLRVETQAEVRQPVAA